jgi:hypothetical protein
LFERSVASGLSAQYTWDNAAVKQPSKLWRVLLAQNNAVIRSNDYIALWVHQIIGWAE